MSDTTNKYMVEDLQVVQPLKLYTIDVEKIETVKDLAIILESAGISFSHFHPNFKKMKHLLKEVRNDQRHATPTL